MKTLTIKREPSIITVVQEKTNDRKWIWTPVLFALVLIIGMLVGMRLQSAAPSVRIQSGDMIEADVLGQGRVEDLIRYIEAKYVDDVDREELLEEAIDGLLEDLDPHSLYMSPDELARANEHLQGNFDGIGVEFMVLEDTIVVVSALIGGPSETVGILSGDKIVMIEDSLIAGRGNETQDVVDMLRGKKGTEVRVGIKRAYEEDMLEFTITRDKIPSNSLDIAYMLDEKTGYMRINKFSATTYDEFIDALADMVEKQGMKDLVLDFRGNSGGYLKQATRMLSQLFADNGKLLVYTEGRVAGRRDYKSSGHALFPVEEVVVLIDEASASASEIVAGAIQDHDRGVLIGRRSYGKGLVQEQYPLRGGSALRLTVARYYTPSGRSIQKPYSDLDDYSHDLSNRWTTGELSDEEKVEINDTTRFYTDNGHVVYGGGGIIPDIFVPIDTNGLGNETYIYLRQLIPSFVFRYAEEHAQEFSEMSLENYQQNFRVDQSMMQELLEYAEIQEVDIDAYELGLAESRLKRDIRVRMAKQFYGDLGAYSIQNQTDKVVQKALEVLDKPNPLANDRKE